VVALASLDVARAVAYNPLVALAAAGLLVACVLGLLERLLGRPLLSPEPVLRRPRLLRAIIVALLVANWAYLLLTPGLR